MLDTHLVLWWLTRAQRVPDEAQELVENADHPAAISHASLWEMAIKISIGKLEIDLPRFVKMAEASGFEWLDIKKEHLLALAVLPPCDDHRDPFDRLLVAQSQAEPLVLLTCDAKLARYGSTVRVV
ncbi:MAG: type II toxin-antitoxin system VapC family toxin [Sulfurimicrobium sp.]|nr:type II toxin-antitoxin system VapC family toxin [Sulfurimicrobium sp.]